MNPDADFHISNHGTIMLMTPLTEAAHEWVDQHLELEGWQWLGGGFAVEPRCVPDLAAGIETDGLVITS